MNGDLIQTIIDTPLGQLAIYAGEGSGIPITLLNGHTRSSSDFRLFSKYLSEKGFKAYTLDNRGFGSSIADDIYDFEQLCLDVETMWRHFGLESTHLLGISMGGMIAQQLALTSSISIQKLILVSTSPVMTQSEIDTWGTNQDEVFRKLEKYFAPSFVEKNKVLVNAMVKQILKSIEDGSFQKSATCQRKAMAQLDMRDKLAEIKNPCLVIHGTLDQIIPLTAAKELATKIPDAILHEFEGSGHLLLAEASKKLYETVSNWLGEN